MDCSSKIHISQFYPCSKIINSAELCYISELSKYLRLNYNKILSLDGVLLDAELKMSTYWDYFRILINEGCIVDTNLSEDELSLDKHPIIYVNYCKRVKNIRLTENKIKYDYHDNRRRVEDPKYNMHFPEDKHIKFTSKTDSVWLLDCSVAEASMLSDALNSNCPSQAWVSLLAYVAVERLMLDLNICLVIRFSHNIIYTDKALSLFLTLENSTNCLHGWLWYSYTDDITKTEKLHLGYSTWYMEGREKGIVGKTYTPKQKLDYMKKLDIEVGDVVMLYKRSKDQKRNLMKSIEGCYLAVIDKVEKEDITFTIVHNRKLYYQSKKDYDNYTMAVKEMFKDKKPQDNLRISNKKISIYFLGIEYYLYDEEYFIVPLSSCNDTLVSWVSCGVREDKLKLSQNDFIYWLFEDYRIGYNKDKFLNRYFSQRPTLYDTYMRTGSVPDEYYFVEDNSSGQ